jgi:hypothetical protein
MIGDDDLGRDVLELDPGLADQLLDGALAPQEAPLAYVDVADLIRSARSPGEPWELVSEADTIRLIQAVLDPVREVAPRRRRGAVIVVRAVTAKAAAVTAAVTIGVTAVAAAGLVVTWVAIAPEHERTPTPRGRPAVIAPESPASGQEPAGLDGPVVGGVVPAEGDRCATVSVGPRPDGAGPARTDACAARAAPAEPPAQVEPPGQGAAPPGLGGSPPPGPSGAPPGLGGTPPGLGGIPPGTSGTPPGLGGAPPGLGGAPPGPGGIPPAPGGTPPALGGIPPSTGPPAGG